MLEALRKALGSKEAAKPEHIEVKLSAEIDAAILAAVDAAKLEFATYKEAADAAMAEAASTVTALQAELADMAGKLTEATAALAAAEAAKVEAAASAQAVKLAARKDKVIAAVGTERADALMKVTEGMEDAAFDAVVAALGVGAEAEAANPLFNEVGVDAQADAGKVVEESAEMKILKAKYQSEQK